MSQKVANEMSQPCSYKQLLLPAHHFYSHRNFISKHLLLGNSQYFKPLSENFKKLFRPLGILNRNTSYPSEISEFSDPLQKMLSTYRWCNKIIQTPRKLEQQYFLLFRSLRILRPPSEKFFNRGTAPCKLSNFVIPLKKFTFYEPFRNFTLNTPSENKNFQTPQKISSTGVCVY